MEFLCADGLWNDELMENWWSVWLKMMSKGRSKIIKWTVAKARLGEPTEQVRMGWSKFKVRKETLLSQLISKYDPCFNPRCIRGAADSVFPYRSREQSVCCAGAQLRSGGSRPCSSHWWHRAVCKKPAQFGNKSDQITSLKLPLFKSTAKGICELT